MDVRKPAVAGHFYPGTASQCRAEIEGCLSVAGGVPRTDSAAALLSEVAAGKAELIGGIVPHAGWICSGHIAAAVLAELCRGQQVDTVVLFGAAHRLAATRAVLPDAVGWETPLGEVAVDEQLAAAVLGASEDIEDDAAPHAIEHSIEVQVPFIQHLAPQARILPILVPHTSPAVAIGLAVAEQARLLERRAAFVGSTDLTHYGPRYGYTPRGAGPSGLQWAKNVNDRGIIDLICGMEPDRIVPEAKRSHNACGAGAVAATMAACRRLGADLAVLLTHTTSAEVLRDRYGEMDDAVGYAGLLFARPARV